MWQEILEYFQTLEKRPVERMAFLVGGLLLFWIIEGAIPLIQPTYKRTKLRHAAVNFGFTIIHLLIHTFLAILIVILSDWCKNESFGIVYWTNAGVLTTILLSILVLDFFGGWLVHYTQHKISSLWRFHVIHHSDNNVDVTTGLETPSNRKCVTWRIFLHCHFCFRRSNVRSYDFSNCCSIIHRIYPCKY